MRRGGALLLAAALVTVVPPVQSAPAPEKPCGSGSWVAGTVDLCDGVLVYRDYVYDDYGADTGTPGAATTGAYSTPKSDQRYGTDVNSADLVQLRLAVRDGRLHVAAELNALFRSDSTVLALAVDADNSSTTGGGPWGALGVSSAGWDVLALFDEGDPAANTVTGSIPVPPGETWRVQAVTAVAGGPAMNVAFRGADEQGLWWEDKQAAALKAGDVSAFGHRVDVADLVDGVTRPAGPVTGLHERVYVSDHVLPPGEGMAYEGVWGRAGESGGYYAQRFHFFGRYQPYGTYVPRSPGPHGLQLLLHGFDANHANLVTLPGIQRRFGEDLRRVLVAPLGRGPAGWYSDASERDVLDAMEDAIAAHDVDRDRVFVSGYSMGGYGAYRLASLYPHRFAGMVNWVGGTGDCLNGTPFAGGCPSGAVGNVIDLLGNLRWVPGAMLYSGADEIVWPYSAVAMAERFRTLGNPYVFYMHPVAEHLTYALTDDWRKEAAYTAPLTRTKRPPRVTYRTDEWFGNEALGLSHDRAYWVSDIRSRASGYADVDVTSHGCGGALPETTIVRGAGLDPVPWTSESAVVTGMGALPVGNRVEAVVANVASVTIDVQGACLGRAAVSYRVVTDGPTTVTFTDGRRLYLSTSGTHDGTLPPSRGRGRQERGETP